MAEPSGAKNKNLSASGREVFPYSHANRTGGERSELEDDVLLSLAARAALEVDGVCALEGGLSGGIGQVIGKGQYAAGVRVTREPGGVSFQINAVTMYGVRIPEVAWNLQEHVKRVVESAASAEVLKVNVLIAGIKMP